MTEFEQPTGRVSSSSRRPSAAAAWALVLVAVVVAGVAGRVIDGGGPDPTTADTRPAGPGVTPDHTPVPAAVPAGDPVTGVTPGPMAPAGPSSVWRLGGDGVVGSRGVDLGELRRRGEETRRTLRPLPPSLWLERRQL